MWSTRKGEDMAARRPDLIELGLSVGKRARLQRLVSPSASGEGLIQLLAADWGLEVGAPDPAPSADAADPEFSLRLADQGGMSGIILGIGHAERYLGDRTRRVPCVLQLNGKTDVPPDDEALAPLNATVEDAVRLAAEAVSYTLYAGSPAQYEDSTQLSRVRQECVAFGMPLIVRAVPRGAAIERRGGARSQYAIEYAARAADELGADVVVIAPPSPTPSRAAHLPKPFADLQLSPAESLARVVAAAGRTPVLVDVAAETGIPLRQALLGALEAGAVGVVLGRSLWQHPLEEAVTLCRELRAALDGAETVPSPGS
jgi:class I fructose-bisphosphate aldolase